MLSDTISKLSYILLTVKELHLILCVWLFVSFFVEQVTLHTGLPIPDFYTPGDPDSTGSVC